MNRRSFLTTTAVVGAAGLVGGQLLTACSGGKKGDKLTPLKEPGSYYIPELPDKAIDGRPLKAGLIGCGGRGNGAVGDLLTAADGVTITALGDVFPDRIRDTREAIEREFGQVVPAENCFTGFDAYQKVIDSGVDMVIVATPPVFRPVHFQYATSKGVHSFLEKPICVDAKGYRTIMATAKQAEAKGLSVVTGTQRHHQRAYVESYKKIQEGLIGEITGGNVYWNQGMLWYRERQKGWSDMEWMIRDWVNWKWLSGDQYDNFSIDFEFENGIHMHSFCRQIDGCSSNVSEFVQGTKGSWNSADFAIRDLQGNILWQYDEEAAKAQFAQHNPYVLEHVDWVNHIRKGEAHVEAAETGQSSLAGTMGREAAYTGNTVTWDEISASDLDYMPEKLELGKMDMAKYTVPVPGTGK